MAEKRKRVMLDLNQKIEIIKRLKKGETPTSIALIYGVGRTTVNDIKRDAEKNRTCFKNAKHQWRS